MAIQSIHRIGFYPKAVSEIQPKNLSTGNVKEKEERWNTSQYIPDDGAVGLYARSSKRSGNGVFDFIILFFKAIFG